MAEQDGQEKTEAPTERKREKAREDGQVASSKELPSAALLAVATLSFMVMGQISLHQLRACLLAS